MKRRNEEMVMSRQYPFAYKAQGFTNGSPTYEAWADPGTDESEASWIACKNEYDGDGNLTRTKWAQTTEGYRGTFDNVATDLSTLTYV